MGNQQIMNANLHAHGLDIDPLNILQDYLSNRKQRTKLVSFPFFFLVYLFFSFSFLNLFYMKILKFWSCEVWHNQASGQNIIAYLKKISHEMTKYKFLIILQTYWYFHHVLVSCHFIYKKIEQSNYWPKNLITLLGRIPRYFVHAWA